MTTAPRLRVYAYLVAAMMIAAVAFGRPELLALAAPFVLALGFGLLTAGPVELGASIELEQPRCLEGGRVAANLAITSATAVEWLEVELLPPRGLTVEPRVTSVVRMGRGERRTVRLGLRTQQFGAYSKVALRLRARDPLRLLVWRRRLDLPVDLRVFPREPLLRSMVDASRPGAHAGDRPARRTGDGIEFAEVRPFAQGDKARRINWRASARRGELFVSEHHPERNLDLVLFLDSFAGPNASGQATLELGIRAAAALARRALERRDRVGLVSFGATLRWLFPGEGIGQLYRLVDTLLASEVGFSYAWKDARVIPRRALPSRAIVVALTPLLDERSISALLDLRARRYELVVVEASPLRAARGSTADPRLELAYRLWRLRREALRGRFLRLGVPVVGLDDPDGLERALQEVNGFRRAAPMSAA